jgi:hypothetical protein
LNRRVDLEEPMTLNHITDTVKNREAASVLRLADDYDKLADRARLRANGEVPRGRLASILARFSRPDVRCERYDRAELLQHPASQGHVNGCHPAATVLQ